ncbi:DUF7528 family protein [Halorubellus salinus]|uniref:DUF7528 family protein n=1 Tax=Halorubellus salinus TaxID=755309 RepID=UPI002222E164|nr:hypothetical protein [Halorubellus salinus]
MSRADAVALKEQLGDAVVADREFFRTAGRHREDGSYEVRRRGADSTGNAKVFRDFDAVERLYERLPTEFDADDVSRTGITGSRRHMLVRHFAEHPAFDCEITTRSPLCAKKTEQDARNADDAQREEVVASD